MLRLRRARGALSRRIVPLSPMAPRHLPLIDEARIYADEAAGSEPRHCGKLGVSRAAYPGSTDGDEREPGSRFTSRVRDLQPSKPAVEALANRRRGLGRTAVAFHAMDQGLPPPPGRPHVQPSWARSRAPWAWIFAPRIRPPQMTSRDFVLMRDRFRRTEREASR